jgi:CRP-like cAMP-binding protein
MQEKALSRRKRKIEGVATLSSKESIVEFLQKTPEFSALPLSSLEALASASRVAHIEAGAFLNHEGDESQLFGFIVVSGCFALTKSSSNGRQLIVELLKPKDVFGLLLMLAIEQLPYQLSARAVQHSAVLWIAVSDFVQLLRRHPELFRELVSHLLLCLNSSYALARGLAHDRVEVRIAAVLLALASKFGGGKETKEIAAVNFTRQQIADLAGTTAETAIRVTRNMQQRGMLDVRRPAWIRILDLPALKNLVEE